ncbi:hypothetical protein PVAND_003996 [Polypedilum vanderplanki]|uniref:GST C-terminal domain-containing protein n=1 Tax=Polypedilum vanderplanki TaxID=319348 RepID=A0A9J6BWU1_POLVA|nr:hypothetical protein PVAND_003996 [Polypedilum vanderplanki]
MGVDKEITKIANYINFPIKGKLSFTEDNIIQMKEKDKFIIGFSTIVNFFHDLNEKEQTQQSIENYYLTKQFFDFANVFIRSTSKRDKYAACLELNEYLETRSYLIGQSLSLADLVVFYALNDIMVQLSPLEKENYLNLSRWYDYLQNQPPILQTGKVINFSTIHLLGWNTARA